MRKVTIELKVKMVLHVDDGQELQEVVDNLDYRFDSDPALVNADIVDTEILDFEVKDSR